MPALLFYRDGDEVPAFDWLSKLPQKVRAECLTRLERLRDLGNELRRPEADFLRDGIYELRASYAGVHYRMLCFFSGSTAVVVSPGITKEREVPAVEIDRAVERRTRFARDPEKHHVEVQL